MKTLRQTQVVSDPHLVDQLRLSWSWLLPLHPMLGESLIARWSDSRRSFHDLVHLQRCLEALDELGGVARAEYLAVWYHNAVCSGNVGRDEKASAAVAATDLLGNGFPWVEVGLVIRLVMVTADHQPRVDLAGADRVNDADLAVLGGSPAQARQVFAALRAESMQLDQDASVERHRAWIETMLDRPRIFHTQAGWERWEEPARQNLAAELSGAQLV